MPHQRLYEEKISQTAPNLNPALAGYFIEYLTYASFAILKHWLETGRSESPEILGELMNEFAVPTASLEIVEKFKDRIK